jgi:mono/diheme cytochrome c family protein
MLRMTVVLLLLPAALQAAETYAPGEKLTLQHCGRCHVINQRNRMGGIGSTPSFGALKSLADWRAKFEAFWFEPPHKAVIQIEGVTEPFHPERPPPMAPVELTEAEVETILKFVETIKAKDLGGDLR